MMFFLVGDGGKEIMMALLSDAKAYEDGGEELG